MLFRMLELVERGGEDDYFSPDLDEQYLNAKYKNVVFDRALFVYGCVGSNTARMMNILVI